MNQERRRFRRVPMPTRIRAQAGGQLLEARAENISVGGMLIRASDTLEENEKVQLQFRLPGTDKDIRATATVLHVSPGAFMGIRFDNLAPADEEAIRRFVESREPSA